MNLTVFAAGSLKKPFQQLSEEYNRSADGTLTLSFGASGLLRKRIENGEKADLFASADEANPQALVDAGRSRGVTVFAANELCAMVAPGVCCTPETLLDAMLDPAVSIGTSTPRNDPSGDYAHYAFWRAEGVKCGAYETLRNKAKILTGGGEAEQAPPERYTYAWIMEQGLADIFLTYRTNAIQAREEVPGLGIVSLPKEISVKARYAMTIPNQSDGDVHALAELLLSDAGRGILANWGFEV